jgi:2-polyprenyl-6-methoxyphenol hydroxylase-like FAD-dependent oxidoreductase
MIHHDVIIVGGGLAGCGLAKSLAEHGIKTVVLERDPVYRDRVRGEQMHPWGIDELRELALYETLLATCGHELPWFDMFLGPQQLAHGCTSLVRRDGAGLRSMSYGRLARASAPVHCSAP